MSLLTWFVVLAVAVVVLVVVSQRMAPVVRRRRSAGEVVGVVTDGAIGAIRDAGRPFVGRRAADRLVTPTERGSMGDDTGELRRLIDELPEAVVLVDLDGVIQSTNVATATLVGRAIDGVVGVRLVELLDAFDVVPSAVSESTDAGSVSLATWWGRCRAGDVGEPLLLRRAVTERVDEPADERDDGPSDELVIECSARPSRGAGPDRLPDRLVVRLRDVSERERHSAALESARRRFQQAFHSAPTGMALVRLDDGRVVDANQSLAEMLGLDIVHLVGRTLRELTHPDDVREAVPHQARLELGIVDSYQLDQRYRRADGDHVWARTRVAVTEDDGVVLAITHIEDITEQRRAAELLTYAARHDDLTGLPNRPYLMQLLTERLHEATPGSVAVLFVDLDHFKVVNDSLGHGIGDELLQAMADRLREVVRGADVLARFGGDEFVVILDGAGRTVDAHEVAERIRRSLVESVSIGDNEFFVTASIGYSTNADPAMTPHDLLRFADAAMYRAKARGRDAIEAFDPADPEASEMALRTANELRRGIERGEVVPYFQPIVDLTTGVVVGHEVLARWLHPDRGLLTPAAFLALAEETGQMVELGASMLRDSLSQLARWRAAGHEFARGSISVNVGTRQLIDPDFYRLVGEVLAETGIDADSLWLEITETSLLADVKTVSVALRELRSLGLHLSVDDFGTGYSSLTYLRRFPVEAIKIDRAFVSGLGIEHDDSTIVGAVVKLGQALGLTVVAEGVETPLQLSMLRELGCHRGQGYLFGRPRPAALIERERIEV